MNEDFISNRIDELCNTHKISRYRLSQKTGITQTALSKIISQKSIPNIVTIEKICNAFEITLSQFFMDKNTLLELTDVQYEILNTWNDLNEDEKRIFLNFIRSIKKPRDGK